MDGNSNSIQAQIFSRLLADGAPLMAEPIQAREIINTGRLADPADPVAKGGEQAHVAHRLRQQGLRLVKTGGRWICPLSEIARWMSTGCAGATTEPSKRPGSTRWGKPGRPSNAARAMRAASAQEVRHG
ncbi:hypothetical protein [Metallibacterium sp.]|uniref:hypothetical protein n=1 Tax=Metallibacterium sp. TaxID=2940281 RepID=UPI00263A3796|nr:hypothetical protein [Metallibacterium sp.]